MKNPFRAAVSIFILAIAVGCTSVSSFRPYVGTQLDWPTAAGAFVEPGTNGIPIYTTWPDRPYHVLGEFTMTGDILRGTARQICKRHGGDALVMQNLGTLYAGTVHGGATTYFPGANTTLQNSYTFPTYYDQASFVVIKFVERKLSEPVKKRFD